MADYYSELNVDGVTKDIYDKAAVHEDQLAEAFNTLIADASFKATILDMFYPVGSLKFGGGDPSTYLGGTWVLRPDLMIVGAGNKYSEGATGGNANARVPLHNHTGSFTLAEGGAHKHLILGSTNTAGNHTHTTGVSGMNFTTNRYTGTESVARRKLGTSGNQYYAMTATAADDIFEAANTGGAGNHSHLVTGSTTDGTGAHSHALIGSINSTGEDPAEMNMPPYLAKNIWERTL